MPRIKLSHALIGCLWWPAVAQAQFITNKPADEIEHAKRLVTVADTIRMTQIGDRSSVGSWSKKDGIVEFSPDRTKFVLVTQKGNLENNTREFSLLVFKTSEVFHSPKPETVATLASSSNREAISHVSWLPDNETVVFLGEGPGDSPQLYKVSCTTKRIERITNHQLPIIAYAVDPTADRFVYIAKSELQAILSEDELRRGLVVTNRKWFELFANRYPGVDSRLEWDTGSRDIFLKTPKLKQPERVATIVNADWRQGLAISPNGRFALLAVSATNASSDWNAYEDETFRRLLKPCIGGDFGCFIARYLLIDLNKAEVSPLIDAPNFPGKEAFDEERFAWIGDGNEIVLVNAFLPLKVADEAERKRRETHLYCAEIKLPSKEIVKIVEQEKPFQADSLTWDPRANQLAIKTLGTVGVAPAIGLRKERNKWKQVKLGPSDQATDGSLVVTLEEDVNSPPKLFAIDPRAQQRFLLLDLNPQFRNLKLGRVEVIHWKTADGEEAQGGLVYYPPDYLPGRRYPLVIQTHGFHDGRFWINGPFGTAYAAQPLASHGFVVLQMSWGKPEEAAKHMGTSSEGPYAMRFYESAVASLDKAGIIDRNRVGLQGFSRTVYHVLYALTHPHYHYGAAVVADGVKYSFADCMLNLFPAQRKSDCETINGGGPPYGETLVSNWAKSAVDLNLDKVDAPLLLQAINYLPSEWEIYAGLRWLNKPAEVLYFPAGIHDLVKPGERMTSSQITVDWFRFWLNGEEDPDPKKAEQYARWRELRKLHQQNEKKPATPSPN